MRYFFSAIMHAIMSIYSSWNYKQTTSWNFFSMLLLLLVTFFLLYFSVNNLVFATQTNATYNTCVAVPKIMQNISFAPAEQTLLNAKSQVFINDTYHLAGDASVRSPNFYLQAQNILLNEKNNLKEKKTTLSASGNVSFFDEDILLNAASLSLSKTNNQKIKYTLANVNYQFLKQPFLGTAKYAYINDNEHIFHHATYSSCLENIQNTKNRKIWQAESSYLNINLNKNRATAKDIVLKIMGVPVFYFPEYTWTLNGRASGFLTPEFSRYRTKNRKTSYKTRIPYYFNIASDRDLILGFNHLNRHGNAIDTHYRQLLTSGHMEAKVTYLQKDTLTQEKRWLLKTDFHKNLNDNTLMYGSLYRVSDSDFFTQINQNGSNIKTLKSTFNLLYNEEDTSAYFKTNSYQAIDASPSYRRAPELFVEKNFPLTREDSFALRFLATQFKHSDNKQKTGVRLHSRLNYNRDINVNNYRAKPELNLYHTHYQLENFKEENFKNEQRTLFNINLDNMWHFERNITLFNHSFLQTLTPRIFYNYTQNKSQKHLPNFDAKDINEQNYASLFSTKAITSIDRILNANQITLGINSNIIDRKSGITYAEFRMAQAFYKEGLNNPLANKKRSPIITEIFNKAKAHQIYLSLHYDTYSQNIFKQHLAWTYQKNAHNFLTLALHKDNGKTLEFYTKQAIRKKIHFFAGITRTLSDNINNKIQLGFAYDNCCFTIRLAHGKNYTDNQNYDNTVKIEFTLKGFSSFTPKTNHY